MLLGKCNILSKEQLGILFSSFFFEQIYHLIHNVNKKKDQGGTT
jgi:hypothetical protein